MTAETPGERPLVPGRLVVADAGWAAGDLDRVLEIGAVCGRIPLSQVK